MKFRNLFLAVPIIMAFCSFTTEPNAESYYQSGHKHYAEKEFLKAIGDFTMAISLKPDFGPAYLERAKAKMAFAEKMGFANKEFCFDLVQALQLGLQEAAPLLEETCDKECFGYQKAFLEPEIVFCADFSSKILTDLPKGSEALVNLVKLNMFNNHLRELSPTFGNLSSLLLLDLSSNSLEEVGPTIAKLTHLEELNLNKNQIVQLPEEIGKLENLKKLYLRSNQLTEISPALANCNKLEQLDLSLNKLTSLPEEIQQLKNLKVLNLVGNPIDKKNHRIIKNNLPNTEIFF